ncbi:MAG: peptidylprolyl isomerase [Vicinamibacterales bacterium]
MNCATLIPRFCVRSLVLVAAGAVAACSSKPATPVVAPVSADTWATVSGHAIMKEEVDKAYRRAQEPAQALSPEETLTAKLNVLNDLIVQELLFSKARALNIDVAQADLDAAYANAKKNIPDEAYQQELTRRNVSADDMREGLRRELLAQKVLAQEVGAKVVVADQEIADFFAANKPQFNIPEESYRLAQIVITPVRERQLANSTGDDVTTPQEATAKAQMLMDRLKAGTTFSELAAGYSEDPESAPRGGDLGFVPLSRLKQAPAQLRDAVLNKAPGSVNVATLNGGHTIVLVMGHEMAGQRDLASPGVRDGISQTLRARKEQLLRVAYLTAVRTDASIVNYLARQVVEAKGQVPSAAPAAAAPAAAASK